MPFLDTNSQMTTKPYNCDIKCQSNSESYDRHGFFGTKLRGGQNFLLRVGSFFNRRDYSKADWVVPLLFKNTAQRRPLKTASRQLCNFRLQTQFWLVSAAWPVRSCTVFRQVFVERRRYRHLSLRLTAPLPRLGLAKALEGLAMLCWFYNHYVLKLKNMRRR